MTKFEFDTDGDLVAVHDAIVVPPLEEGIKGSDVFGVLTPDGQMVENAIHWRDSTTPTNTAPAMPEGDIDRLAGTWMFGGTLYGHFGHLITETYARAWAIDALRGQVEGLLFTPKQATARPRRLRRLLSGRRGMLAALGVDVPSQALCRPTRVETLYVPRQGVGMSDLTEGSQKFRDFVNAWAGQGIAPVGPKRLYISRSELQAKRGGLICEALLEDYLSAEGYEIYHPQQHAFEEQIAAYKAASHVICADSSPLHLLAYVGNASQKVAVIARRSTGFAAGFVAQLKAFKGMAAFEVSALQREWVPGQRRNPGRDSFGELDLPAVWDALKAQGMLAGDTPWPALTDAQRRADLDRIDALHDEAFAPLDENRAVYEAQKAARRA